MKAKITKKDGTVLELEGEVGDIMAALDHEAKRTQPPITLTPPAAPSCPGIGRMIDELTKGQKQQDQWTLPWQPRFVYNDQCPMGGQHDYPAVWMSVSPPACSKCGRALGPAPFTSIISTLSGQLGQNGTKYATTTTLPQIPFISAFTVVGAESQS